MVRFFLSAAKRNYEGNSRMLAMDLYLDRELHASLYHVQS